ncbi:uncharacterized protein LOC123549003 isoform X2 [Mercenaria mercenaria]|uniref:uncharacterized protein LOC123549003 isoform X2 n=1 Tax=Mercenaria mercenaria TaxID=6596 RepID=UPI00234E81A9|nr:uncharacterized protein LOC123549003 isoform X2 [Mercenaria mercenaria]
MQGSTQENDENEIARVRRRYMILFVVKCLLGIILLILGGVAVKYTMGQKDTFGPPYFVGAFIVGCAACIEVFLTVITIIGGVIGTFFVSIFGVPKCDPSDFFSRCNYTANRYTNQCLAVGILTSLLVSEIIAIGSIVMHCRSCKGLAPYNMLKARQRRFAGGVGNVVMTTVPEPRPLAGGFGANRNYDSYSADTQIIIDGNVIDKNRSGFAGAIIHPLENTTVIHPPVGYFQYPSMTNQNTQYSYEHQGSTSGASVHQLQEQNRLLREQIALQQQLHLMQQEQQQQPQQQSALSTSLPPPPPSYESCMQDPGQMKFLQEQNEELQNRYQSQQQQLTKEIPFSSDRNTTPSAPPM